ncbi:MAG: pilus (MSHA type) biogenesis protein MshL [Sulfuritalea sp.]|nr:pilus (MSHA type) biogenesis protein MshL [Sulfuritalea sp.]
MLALALSACAHESTVQPSKGHIDGQVTAQSSTDGSKASTANIPKPVVNNAYLPPPKPATKEQTYSIVVYDTPVKEVLFAIARDSKLNVDIHPSIQGNVTLNAVDQTLPAILERLSKQVDLTYKIQGSVLTIAPDSPVLRTYQINYVNMQRTTKGGISVKNEIASSAAATVGSATTGSTSSGTNTSSTSVESESKNYFWDSLIQNIKDILAESDKEVLVNRLGTDKRLQSQYDVQAKGTGSASVISAGKNTGGGANGSGDQSVQGGVDEKSEQNLKSYKTLFAASVIANKETGVLSIRATQRQHQSIQEFIDRVQAGAKRQVLIEASIVEITLNDKYQAGVDWSLLGSGALSGFNFKQELLGTSLTAAPRMAIGYSKSTGIGDLAPSIRLLQTFGNTKVLSSPKLMVLNSQTAILKVVNNLVYFTVKADTTTNDKLSYTSYSTIANTVPVGVWMSVTPQINENSAVTLNVRPTISRQSGSKRDPNPSLLIESLIPEIEVREMESMLQVNSGNTVILGGLMQDEITGTNNGVPGLMKLPAVGKAFSARDQLNRKTELVIFLRPTVISNASLESDELSTYKQYLPTPALERASKTNAASER